tara:strand:+ start:1138 stop:1569 length:432 start_codon:yes stop_codon:yes gene_type:complete
MGFFSFIKRVGNKVADGIHSAAKVGKKVLGTVHSVGNKIYSAGTTATSVIKRIPVIGATLSPVTGAADAALGMVKNVADVAGAGNQLITKGDNLVSKAQKIINIIPDEQTNSSVQRAKPNPNMSMNPSMGYAPPGATPLFRPR